jgi:ring-1,2-phenylacetyl-CoA epoxidase subunit PaaB
LFKKDLPIKNIEMKNSKDTQLDLWEVFVQGKSGAPYIHSGSVHASDKKMALQNARDIYTRRGEGTSIWVVPSVYITASDPNNNEMFFDPSDDKIYRHPTFYIMPEGAKQI